MQLNDRDLFLLSRVAMAAAYEAGHLIAANSATSDRQLAVKSKTGGGSLASQVLTEVDLLSQQAILQHILPTCERYDLALLAEESVDDRSRLDKEYFWSIDPLDGTLPFIEATEGYSVSIALLSREGIPQLGVIYDPRKGDLYRGVRGQGALLNGMPLKAREPVQGAPLTVVMDRGFLKAANYEECMETLKAAALAAGYSGLKTISHGGAAMNSCWVLANSPACYFKLPKKGEGGGSIWDFAASASIFNECGAPATDIYGHPLELNRPDSTFMNHKGVLYASSAEIAQLVRGVVSHFSHPIPQTPPVAVVDGPD